MLQVCDRVVSVHGCGNPGEVVLLGGRDHVLRTAIVAQLKAAGLTYEDAPAGLAGTDPHNICNRGRTGALACSWRSRWTCGDHHDGEQPSFMR